ncbi:MAG: NAD(P)-dependent oxidoreductase, partial [Actinobacteria bacterium]|nr:NAD(P)-dependent oxidoreductase [Actinomycetota bacterium]
MTKRTVAVVGLGAMGRPIAEFIAKAGFQTLGYDHAPSANAQGVQVVGRLADVAPADVVLVIVPADEDVRSVVSAPDGLIAASQPGRVIVISSSVTPQTCRDLAAEAAERGVHVIDAALTGGVRGAETGKISLLVGGPQDVVDSVADVFA